MRSSDFQFLRSASPPPPSTQYFRTQFGPSSVFRKRESLRPLGLPSSVSREAQPKFGGGSVSGMYRDSIKENLLRFFSLLVSSTSGSTDYIFGSTDYKSLGGNAVPVRFRLRAPLKSMGYADLSFCFIRFIFACRRNVDVLSYA